MNSSPHVLCIAGSPRRHGNSDRLLDALAQGVTESGGEPIRLVVSEAGISPCRGCHRCSSDGRCVVHDGMDDVYRLLDSVDAIAVANPVFFATVPSVLKTMYDRCQPYWARRYVLGQVPQRRKRPGAALVVGGGGDPFGTSCAVTPTNSVFGVLGVSLDHVLEVVGPDAPKDIERYPTELERAMSIGRELVNASVGTVSGE